MNPGKFISGIFSVYDSTQARDFKDSDRYPIAFEVIFRNDAAGQEFATKLQIAVRKFAPERAVLYHVEGMAEDRARSMDCFFSDADTFRWVLNESLPGIGINHDERGILPKMTLIEEAQDIVADLVLER